MSAKTEDVEAAIKHLSMAVDLPRTFFNYTDTTDAARTILASHAAQAERIASLEAAGQAVVDRWDTPAWKDAEPTAHVINRLRAILLDNQGEA